MIAPLRTPVIAGNWKMHKGPTATRAFFADFLAARPTLDAGSVLLFPPALSLAAAVAALAGRTDVRLGVQNLYWEGQGAFTGEISAPMAVDAGATFALVGHSERRHVFGETDDEVRRKVAAALAAGLGVVACVGETLEERRAGRVDAVILRQLDTALDAVAEAEGVVAIAYEPVWAIGTDETATPEDAASAHATLRARLGSRLGERAATVPILYGGSVKPDNVQDLLAAPGVGGVLVGGASLDAAVFARLTRRGG